MKLDPLLEVLEGSERGYPFVRCAALYSTTVEYSEKTRDGLTAEETEMASDWIGFFIVHASLAREIPPEEIGKAIDDDLANDINAISARYELEFEQSYLSSGQPFSAMVREDLAVCQALKRNLE